MPVLNLNEGERNLLVTALAHDRARRMHEWEQIGYDNSRINPDGDRWVIDGVVDAITDLRRKIEAGEKEPKAAWHHEHGWLHSKKDIEDAKDAGEVAGFTREEFVEIVDVDLVEVGAENSRDQDQVSPGTWTTLPEGFDVDTDPFEITDPEEKVVVASVDTQIDGAKVYVVEININGVTRTVCAPKSTLRDFERNLDHLQEICRAYL